MKAIVTDYLNVRVGRPSLNAPCYQYASPGSELILEDKVYTGDFYDGLNTWLKDEAGNFYWSGAINMAPDFPGHDTAWYLSDFGIPEIWNITKGENVTVVLIDSGIYSKEVRLPGSIEEFTVIAGEVRDKIGHGTCMLSILKGFKDFLGVAPSIHVQSIKITDREDLQSSDFIKSLKLLKTLVNTEKQYVVNCSLAMENCSDTTKLEIRDLISEISKGNNIVFCAAVGNCFGSKTTPASIGNVISVAGLKKENGAYERLGDNNYWPSISLACPGKFDLSCLNPLFEKISSEGSSHACAYAAGIMALICAARLKHGRKTNDLEMIDIVKKITTPTSSTNKDNYVDSVLNKTKLLTQLS